MVLVPTRRLVGLLHPNLSPEPLDSLRRLCAHVLGRFGLQTQARCAPERGRVGKLVSALT